MTSEPNFVGADDLHVAIVKDRYPAPSELTLLDEQTHTQRDLAAPSCTRPLSPEFGGRWLMVNCGSESYALYDLASGQWSSFEISPKCPGQCQAIALGRRWVKLVTDGGCSTFGHCPTYYYLQSIATSEVKPDPVTPGGRNFDDLNSQSGTRPLCSPLRYPGNGRREPGQLVFARPFGLAWGDVYSVRKGLVTVYHLERCGSRLDRTETENPPAGTPLLSSRAMAWIHQTQPPNSTFTLVGWLLPGLRPFKASLPAPLRGQNGAVVVALSHRTVYVRTYYRYSQLWAATLPAQTSPRLQTDH